jgi:hypothetical protein
MTTAAVKAAAITFKIFFFMDHPVLGLRSESFNMTKTDRTVTHLTERRIARDRRKLGLKSKIQKRPLQLAL